MIHLNYNILVNKWRDNIRIILSFYQLYHVYILLIILYKRCKYSVFI